MADGSYTFGDSALAARRLALLAEVFKDATAGFLRRLDIGRPNVAVDLGCGPGFTTTLLRDVLAPDRVIGVDASAAFVDEAAQRLGSTGELLCADVRDLPDQVHDADLIFARFLLTHLTEPVAAIEHWLARLSPTGVVAVEEVETITTDDAILARYLELQRRMLEANGQLLEIGPLIENATRGRGEVLQSDVASVTPSTSAAARMFAMNFATWRTRPVVVDLASPLALDEIETGLTELASADGSSSSISWELRQLSIAAN